MGVGDDVQEACVVSVVITLGDVLTVAGIWIAAEIAIELRRQIRLRRTTLRPLQQINRR